MISPGLDCVQQSVCTRCRDGRPHGFRSSKDFLKMALQVVSLPHGHRTVSFIRCFFFLFLPAEFSSYCCSESIADWALQSSLFTRKLFQCFVYQLISKLFSFAFPILPPLIRLGRGMLTSIAVYCVMLQEPRFLFLVFFCQKIQVFVVRVFLCPLIKGWMMRRIAYSSVSYIAET